MILRASRVKRVGELMRREFVTAWPEEPLHDALCTMQLARLRELSVARHGVLVGVLCYREVLDRRGAGEVLDETSVARAMRAPGDALVVGDRIADAARRLLESERGSLPVVATPDGLELIGLVTETDLLRAAFDPWFRGTR